MRLTDLTSIRMPDLDPQYSIPVLIRSCSSAQRSIRTQLVPFPAQQSTTFPTSAPSPRPPPPHTDGGHTLPSPSFQSFVVPSPIFPCSFHPQPHTSLWPSAVSSRTSTCSDPARTTTVSPSTAVGPQGREDIFGPPVFGKRWSVGGLATRRTEADQVEAIWTMADEDGGREMSVAGLVERPRMCSVDGMGWSAGVVLRWEKRRVCARPRASWDGDGPGGESAVGARTTAGSDDGTAGGGASEEPGVSTLVAGGARLNERVCKGEEAS